MSERGGGVCFLWCLLCKERVSCWQETASKTKSNIFECTVENSYRSDVTCGCTCIHPSEEKNMDSKTPHIWRGNYSSKPSLLGSMLAFGCVEQLEIMGPVDACGGLTETYMVLVCISTQNILCVDLSPRWLCLIGTVCFRSVPFHQKRQFCLTDVWQKPRGEWNYWNSWAIEYGSLNSWWVGGVDWNNDFQCYLFGKINCSPFGLYISAWRPNLCVAIQCHPKNSLTTFISVVFFK